MSANTAEVSRTIAARPSEVWQALVTPKTIKRYFFGADVKSDWRVGSPIVMKGEFHGKPYEDKGQIIALVPQRKLSFSHWSPMGGTPDKPEFYHLVTYDLAPDGDGTRVTLSQANLKGGVTLGDIEHQADYEKNWNAVLDGLEKVVAH